MAAQQKALKELRATQAAAEAHAVEARAAATATELAAAAACAVPLSGLETGATQAGVAASLSNATKADKKAGKDDLFAKMDSCC